MHKYKFNSSTTYHILPTIYQKAFTIVELLVVIVVIGILAAITIVSYTGISQKAVASALQSDLDNASKQLKLYQVDHSAYPVSLNTSNCPLDSSSNVDTNYCLKLTSGNSRIGYSANNSTSSQSFLLIAGNGNTNYQITNTTAPVLLAQLQPGVTPGAVLELHAAKANNGTGPGINSPLTITWKDTSGNGNNGTLNGFSGTPWAGAGTPSDPYRLMFDGDSVIPSSPPIFAKKIGTIEAWFKAPTSPPVGAWDLIYYERDAGSIARAMFGVSDGGSYIAYFHDSAAGVGIISGGNGIDGGIHHLVLTMGGTDARLYSDGAQIGVTSALPAGSMSGIITPFIGSQSGSSYWWRGGICVVRGYPFALTPAQVSANYNAGSDW